MARNARVTFCCLAGKPRIEVDPRGVADRLLSSWLPPLERRSWAERLELIKEIDEQIEEDFGEGGLSRLISQDFTTGFIERLPTSLLSCREQALVYLNASAPLYREAGHVWLVLHAPDVSLFEDEVLPEPAAPGVKERRQAARHLANFPGTLATQGRKIGGKLIDVSSSGARMKLSDRLGAAGTRVVVDLPLLDPLAASVMWVTAGLAGLMFLAEPAQALL